MKQKNHLLQDLAEDAAENLAPELRDDNEERELKVKLDKWLWAARFFKTRALARNAVENGKVLYNNETVKPTTEIALDATVNIRLGRYSKVVIIKGLSTRRKNATESLNLFVEVEPEEQPELEIDPYNTANNDGSSEYTIKPRKVIRFLRRPHPRDHDSNGNS